MADHPKKDIQHKTYKKNYPKRNQSNEHCMRKRTPRKPDFKENVVYVNNRSNFMALLSKCEKLLIENDHNEIFINGMGNAIARSVNLALLLCEKHATLQVAVNTGTVTLTDDLEPLTDDVDYEVQNRQNSTIRIHVFKDPKFLPKQSENE